MHQGAVGIELLRSRRDLDLRIGDLILLDRPGTP
jgi:hypothetical protein